MANSRKALFRWNITKGMSAGGWEYVSCPEFPLYRLIKREEECLLLRVAGEGYGLTSVNDARYGKLQDPEKQRLAEIIDRIERSEAVMAQARSYIEDQMLHALLPNKVTDAVLDALSDHEKQACRIRGMKSLGGGLRC